ncbi:MAG: DUF6526 family protein [Rhodothermales bacterium]
MAEQNFANHARMVPGFHYFTFLVLLLTFIGAGVNMYEAWGTNAQYSASLILALCLLVTSALWYCRVFALKAQDRAIRAEENLRSFVRTGRPLDSRLSMAQIVGLRFASDDEVDALAARAVSENLSQKAIKQAITNWKADHHRV